MPTRVHRLFARPKPVIGVIHTGPSPGVPGATDVRCLVDRASAEAQMLVEAGVDGLLVENAHDVPAMPEDEIGPEVVAFMTRVCAAVKRHAGRLPVGVRVFEGANRVALAVACGASCDFVRVQGWAGDPADAARFHRYQRALGAERVPVLADLRPTDADDARRLVEATEAARPDGLVVLGPRVGQPLDPDVMEAACRATNLPTFCGGGLDATNLPDYLDAADGFLVGSGLKEAGRWQAPICEKRVRAIVGAVEYARGQEVRQ